MNHLRKQHFSISLIVAVLTSLSGAAPQSSSSIPEKDLQSIEKFSRIYKVDEEAIKAVREIASGLQLPASPGEARRILVYGISHGPHMFNIPTCTEAIRILGGESGAYDAVVTNELTFFEPELLATFDAVCFANTTGEVMLRPIVRALFDRLPEDQKHAQLANQDRLVKNLTDYVKQGGGFIGIHAATDSLKRSALYGEMIGGYFDGHPWSGSQTVSVLVERPKHPLCRDVFTASHFSIKDEIYQFKEPYDRSSVTVLLSIDLEKSEKPKKELTRPDKDYPVSWIKDFGQGRVFYCSLGHNTSVFASPEVLQFMLGGIQYAIGDLELD